MPSYASKTELPKEALGSDGRLALLLASADFAVAPLTDAPNGPRIIKDFPVFKTGKLKDSSGKVQTWTRAKLAEIVKNFDHLKSSGIFPNVPVRENHGRDVKEIGGYFQAVRLKGDTLYADIELTEPDVIARYDRGTYRSRSIELGAYETNTGEVFFPVVMGLAFCDIPAVEGLYSASLAAYSDENREVHTFAAAESAEDGPNEDELEFAPVLAALHALATKFASNPEFHSAVMAVIGATEKIRDSNTAEDAKETASTSKPKPKTSTHSGAPEMSDTFKFTLGGREVELQGDAETAKVLATFASDLAERDSTIATLNAEKRDAEETARVAKVDAWLGAKKITPGQLDGLKAFVKTLSPEQFAAHDLLVTSGPDLAFTAPHADGTSADDAKDDREAQIRMYRQTYAMSKAAGVSGDKLASTSAAKALVALGVALEG